MGTGGRPRKKPAVAEGAAPAARTKLSVDVHPELLKRLKIAAIQDGRTVREKLHEVLCEALGRKDLTVRPGKAASA